MDDLEREILSRRDAAKFLNICERTLDTMTREGKIPHFRIRNRVLYCRKTLVDFVTSHQCCSVRLTTDEAILFKEKSEAFFRAWLADNDAEVAQLQKELSELGVFMPVLPRHGREETRG